jgi:hypothetical protein
MKQSYFRGKNAHLIIQDDHRTELFSMHCGMLAEDLDLNHNACRSSHVGLGWERTRTRRMALQSLIDRGRRMVMNHLG